MERENKLQIIKDLESLLDHTRYGKGIKIKYGYVDSTNEKIETDYTYNIYAIRNFVESERILNERTDPREMVLIDLDGKKIVQSIEGDSGIAIINDVLNAIK